MVVKFGRDDLRVGIVVGKGQRFSSRRSTAIQNPHAMSRQRRDKLRTFVLNNTQAFAEGGGASNVPLLHTPRRSQQRAGIQFNPIGAKSRIRSGITETNGS